MHEPNHICKYSGCTLGEDGGPKHYYACSYCSRSEAWRAMACCKEHYNLYIQEVLAARESGKEVDTLPERTDMTKDEVEELMKRPVEDVLEEAKEELKDFADEDGTVNIAEAVDTINREHDRKQKNNKYFKNKK